jgi:hypothetical protein
MLSALPSPQIKTSFKISFHKISHTFLNIWKTLQPQDIGI